MIATVSGRAHPWPLTLILCIPPQAIVHYAARIVRLVMGEGQQQAFLPEQDKRNSGMLDAVINMPDLFKAGRK